MTVIVFRYLFRETLKTQLAVLFVLLLIFVSQQFIQIIGDAPIYVAFDSADSRLLPASSVKPSNSRTRRDL